VLARAPQTRRSASRAATCTKYAFGSQDLRRVRRCQALAGILHNVTPGATGKNAYGAGKTTTVGMLTTRVRPSAGPGTPEDLKAAYGGNAEVHLILAGDTGSLARALITRLGESLAGPPDVDTVTGSIRLAVEHGDGVTGHVLRVAEDARAEILDFSVERPSLERVFLNLTGRNLRP
jgi:uncharacterized protein DUF4162